MKRTGLIAVASIVIAIVLLTYWTKNKSKESDVALPQTNSGPTSTVVSTTPPASSAASGSSPSPAMNREEQAAAIVTKVFSAPISFFGKVQDQNGAPISEAKVQFGAVDGFWKPASTYQAVSDANGLFSITGIKGAGLTVGVSKEGYDGIKGFSYQSFGYGMPPDSNRKAPPRREAPAIFVLRKKADADPLIVVHRDTEIPEDGTPVEINLKTGKQVTADHGDLKIECWTSDQFKDANGHYEWRARISIPGGGMIPRINTDLDFIAPEAGYKSTVDISMLQASPAWRRDHDGNYWVKLRDQTYARMRLRLTTGGHHFVTVAAYLNPSGSRNLEYDEDKVIK